MIIIWINTVLLSIVRIGTNFSDIWIKIQWLLFIQMYFNKSSEKWWPFCSVFQVLTGEWRVVLKRVHQQLWYSIYSYMFVYLFVGIYKFDRLFCFMFDIVVVNFVVTNNCPIGSMNFVLFRGIVAYSFTDYKFFTAKCYIYICICIYIYISCILQLFIFSNTLSTISSTKQIGHSVI